MEPFIALMRRYVIDYTMRHDPSICTEIMEPDYTLRMGDHILNGRDDKYIPAATVQFRQYPGLCLTVHDIVTNGDRLAMRFSEHGAAQENNGVNASWRGIGLYRWNGSKLLENHVEQDYLTRRRQLRGEIATQSVDSPAIAPWDTTATPSDPDAEKVVREWIAAGMHGGSVVVDDHSAGPHLHEPETSVDLMFSCGSTVAFRLRRNGIYIGGLPEAPIGIDTVNSDGNRVTLHVVGLVTVRAGNVDTGHLVTDRLGLTRALARAGRAGAR